MGNGIFSPARDPDGMKNNILETIGNTPLVRLNKIGVDLRASIWVKVEYMNPGGSVKDRIATFIIEEAERSGKLKPGGTIVEATSGNTGTGLAMVAAVRGYKCIFVMPDKMSQEKIDHLRGYGTRVIVTPTNVDPEDPRSYYKVARRMVEETPNAFLANQYHNMSNPEAHYKTTGPEIWQQTGHQIGVFVAGLGTGGTISGVGRYLKEQNPNVKVIGADPIGSILSDLFHGNSGAIAQPYVVEGVGEDFKPTTLSFDYIDEIFQVTDKESFLMARRLAREEGIFVGGSCGTAIAGALKYAQAADREEMIVVLLPDSGLTYLSKLYNDEWMSANSYLDAKGNVRELLKETPLVSVTKESLVSEAFQKMKDSGVSQVPVLNEGKVEGMLHEKDLYEYLLKIPKGDPMVKDSGIVSADVAAIRRHTPIEALHDILAEKDAAIIIDEEGIALVVVTKTDVIRYLLGKPE